MARSRSQEIREQLTHPIVDCDGHLIEVLPHYLDVLKKVAGSELADRVGADLSAGPRWLGGDGLDMAKRRDERRVKSSWWAMPTRDVRDCATPLLPRLLHERMDEFGIDFAILYPGLGLILPTQPDTELRRATVRAFNHYAADVFGEYADRMTPAAVIPMHTPEEALEEIEHSVGELGFKTISIAPGVWRPIPALQREHPEAFPEAGWLDNYGLDSAYDYDPFWAKCRELGVAVTSHGGVVSNLPWHGRSISNHMYNHIGTHAYQQSLLCKALLLGGVSRRFPELNFAFLECGVGWACIQYADMIGHWEKRNPAALENLDPSNLDREHFLELIQRYSERPVEGEPHEISVGLTGARIDHEELDEFAALEIVTAGDFRERFTQSLYFGCEADDPTTAWGFDERAHPFGARFRAVFGSDIGHWDVPDMRCVLLEAWELVEAGCLDEGQFREFSFLNAIDLYTKTNPAFFEGTAVASQVAEVNA